MAKMVMTNGYVSINSVDLSDHIRSVTLDFKSELQDATCFGNDTRARLGGLLDWSVSMDLAQDYASGKTDATLFPLVGESFPIAFRPVKTDISATNPEYSGTGILESYPPVGVGVGELDTTSISIQANSDLIRTTTP